MGLLNRQLSGGLYLGSCCPKPREVATIFQNALLMGNPGHLNRKELQFRCVCMYVRMYVGMYMCMYMHMPCIYIYVRMCMCVYMYSCRCRCRGIYLTHSSPVYVHVLVSVQSNALHSLELCRSPTTARTGARPKWSSPTGAPHHNPGRL